MTLTKVSSLLLKGTPTLILAGTLAFTPLSINAQSLSSSSTSSSESSSINLRGASSSTIISVLKERGNKEITRRLNSLNEALTKLQKSTKLTDAQKNPIINNIKDQISSLQTLQAKIASDTDLTTLKEDLQNIKSVYRVYATELPLARLMTSSDLTQNALAKLQTYESKLKDLIAKEQAAGKDVTRLTKLDNDIKLKIADANTQIKNALNILATITPAGFPGNKTQLKAAQSDLKKARDDIKAATKDGKQIRSIIKEFKSEKKLKKGSSSSSSLSSGSDDSSSSAGLQQ